MLSDLTFSLQGIVSELLRLAAFLAGVVALVQAARTRPDAFPAAGKLTKGGWLGILVVATLVVAAFGVLQLLGMIAVVGIIVWWVDVRPALERVIPRGRHDGPYGPW